MGVTSLGGCAQPLEDSAFLAMVDQHRITAGDLRAFVSGLPSSSPPTAEEYRRPSTDHDRSPDTASGSPGARAWKTIDEVLERLEEEKKRKLHEEMMRLEVYDQVSVEEPGDRTGLSGGRLVGPGREPGNFCSR